MPLPSEARPALWIDGVRQPPGRAHVSADDRGVLLADGAFETMRARAGRVLRLAQHLARLRHALDVLAIPEPAPQAAGGARLVSHRDGLLEAWVLNAAAAGGNGDVSMRLTVTRGFGAPGLPPPAEARPTVIVSVRPLPTFPADIYREGLAAHVLSGRRNERALTAGLKTLAYTETVAGWIEANRAGAGEALWLDTEGRCSEALTSNLFVWTGTLLLTPPLECGVLPGITRNIVLELAAARGVPAAERAFDLDVLCRAEEAFLTSTLRGIVGLTRVGDRPIGAGAPGPVTRAFADAYAALVARECGAPEAPVDG